MFRITSKCSLKETISKSRLSGYWPSSWPYTWSSGLGSCPTFPGFTVSVRIRYLICCNIYTIFFKLNLVSGSKGDRAKYSGCSYTPSPDDTGKTSVLYIN